MKNKIQLDAKTIADQARLSAGAKAKLQQVLSKPGALERLRAMGAQIPQVTRELEHVRTDSVVIGSQELFRCAVQFAVDQGVVVLQEGEEVIGGKAVVAKNGIFAEIKIGRPLEEPEETDGAPEPPEALDDALDILSRPTPGDVEAKLNDPLEGQ